MKRRYAFLWKRKFWETKEERRERELLYLMVEDSFITEKEVRSIQNRALVIAGTKDAIKRRHTKRMAALLENSSLVFIEGRHYVSMEQPEKFNETVLSFLKE